MAGKFNDMYARLPSDVRRGVESRVKETLRPMPLDELREARELTRTQLAQTLNVSQGAVSKVERRADMYISAAQLHLRHGSRRQSGR
jgi:DNA-binding transcriptional regulator YiaG